MTLVIELVDELPLDAQCNMCGAVLSKGKPAKVCWASNGDWGYYCLGHFFDTQASLPNSNPSAEKLLAEIAKPLPGDPCDELLSRGEDVVVFRVELNEEIGEMVEWLASVGGITPSEVISHCIRLSVSLATLLKVVKRIEEAEKLKGKEVT